MAGNCVKYAPRTALIGVAETKKAVLPVLGAKIVLFCDWKSPLPLPSRLEVLSLMAAPGIRIDYVAGCHLIPL